MQGLAYLWNRSSAFLTMICLSTWSSSYANEVRFPVKTVLFILKVGINTLQERWICDNIEYHLGRIRSIVTYGGII